jgi:hypothetical protein
VKKTGLTASIFACRGTLVLASALSFYATASLALGTDAERAACTPDVFRLCSSDIPNVDRIVACLVREKPRLSPACQAVVTAAGRTTTTATRSISEPASGWCVFPNGGKDPDQQPWLSWCGSAARKQ